MDPLIVIAIAIPLAVVLAVVVSYNRFVSQRQLIANSWSNVDTELQRRYDLIPNLVETVKGYAAHERAVLERVTEARGRAAANHGSPVAQARDENVLVGAVRQMFAVAERYPDLKASSSFLALQEELVTTEDRIQAARRFFNNNVRDYNRRTEAFPSMLIASMFGFQREEYFEIEEAVRRAGVPQVGLG
jgi:LemA protein